MITTAMNLIEQQLIANQQAREQQAQSKTWFAVKPTQARTTIDIIEQNRQNRLMVPDAERKRAPKTLVREYRNTYEFMLAHFVQLDELIPDKSTNESSMTTIATYQDKKEAIIMTYKNKGNFLRSMDHDYIWKSLKKKFTANYWGLKRDHAKMQDNNNIITSGL